jgi:hypothetical protein
MFARQVAGEDGGVYQFKKKISRLYAIVTAWTSGTPWWLRNAVDDHRVRDDVEFEKFARIDSPNSSGYVSGRVGGRSVQTKEATLAVQRRQAEYWVK